MNKDYSMVFFLVVQILALTAFGLVNTIQLGQLRLEQRKLRHAYEECLINIESIRRMCVLCLEKTEEEFQLKEDINNVEVLQRIEAINDFYCSKLESYSDGAKL